ncbi:MAG TPA: threonine--tRNA ligase [Gemmatimonadales bacterium]|nr:threonine--tRNA ligase [Gemmatimonadales bacterium]
MPPTEISVTLPDGSVRTLPSGATGADLARAIGPGLAKAALAIRVNGDVWDLSRPLPDGKKATIVTDKDPAALDVLRHSSAHVLATAVRQVFPQAKIGFGPPIEDGFYYDFEVPTPFTPEDLERIEAKMREVVQADYPFVRDEVSRADAKRLFVDDPLKLERIDDLGPNEVISIYVDGPFVDLCRGPHVPSTGRIKHFKLLHAAGAYWRGDSRRQMLQRIYGTAWFTKEDLERYVHRLEEAAKRDHRKVGRELDLFMFHHWAPGAPFWTSRGTTMINELNGYLRLLQRDGYQEIKTPLLYNKGLWEQSGHWGKYQENMFLVLDTETKQPDFSLKPMNCPSHYLMYLAGKHSYRELPLRYCTYDVLHRNEVSGALSGLTRVRQFQQDDCHIFLMERQITDEVKRLVDLILGYYRTFGLTAELKFCTRPAVRIGDDAMWDRAEAALRGALETIGLPYVLSPGDGAFYGPKIDFHVADSIGRTWQLGTIQLDYAAPERFGLVYVGEDNTEHRPVVIHRAVSGSFERFMAILIEHFAGAFPLWLAPEQVRMLPIADGQLAAARGVHERLRAAGIRSHLDERSETLNYKIRDGEIHKVPYLAVVGEREAQAGTVAIRQRGAGNKQVVVSVDEFVKTLSEEIRTRSLGPGPA